MHGLIQSMFSFSDKEHVTLCSSSVCWEKVGNSGDIVKPKSLKNVDITIIFSVHMIKT